MNDPFLVHVITRKRKKYKFANFDNFTNCYSFERGAKTEVFANDLKNAFIKKQPLVLELAAGNAQFSLELARRNKNCNFIAIDIKSDRLYTSAKQALAENINNIIFVRTHINELGKIFSTNSVSKIWLTFPDPHPKKRSSKHRLTHPHFLNIYSHILKTNGKLYFKTDNLNLFQWSLEQFVAKNWQLSELSFDLHESGLLNEYKIKTHYEEKFTKLGIKINYTTCSASAQDLV